MVDPTDGLQYEIGLGYSALDAQAERSKLDGYAVVTGLTPTASASGLTVDVAAGDALVGKDGSGSPLRVSNGGGSVTLSAADSALPRKDTVWIDDTGTLQVAEGTPADPLPENGTQFNTFQPEPPVVVDGTVLAEVWVAAGATSLSAADVRDRRQPADVVASEVASESVSTVDLATDNVGGKIEGSGADQTIPNETQTKVEFGTNVVFDDQNEYDTTANHIKCAVGGVYYVGAIIEFRSSTGWSDGDAVSVRPRVNGTGQVIPEMRNQLKVGSEAQSFLNPPIPVEVSAGDEITIEAYQESGESQDITMAFPSGVWWEVRAR